MTFSHEIDDELIVTSYFWLAKTLESASIIYRPDTFVSDRYLIDIGLEVCAVIDGFIISQR